MTRPFRLALIMLLMCAGIVVAAPIVRKVDRGQLPLIATPAPTLPRDNFVLHADQRSGCVWRVSTTTDRRELASQPCKRAKGQQRESKALPPSPPVRPVTKENKPTPKIHNSAAERKSQ